MDKPDLVFISTHKPAWTGILAAFDPLSALQTERAGVKGILNAVVPQIEYRSEFHLRTLCAESLSGARFILIYFEIISRDRVRHRKDGSKSR